ncbi:MAG TPA: hypothetical protein VFA34_06630 [Actinomycetota bacterium]|jgi:hypothetical protein|nr:hypothetical protein [Actinomycetota bacterium]
MTSARKPLSVVAGSLLVLVALSSSAAAQVPSLPSVPSVPDVPIPEPVAETLGEVQGMIVPILVDGAQAASPAANALGFGLRPACAGAGTIIVAGALLGAALPLPINPGLGLTPAFVLCGAAFEPGPADAVFEQADAAAGEQVEDASKTVLEPAATTIAPLRQTLSSVCTVVALGSSTPKYFPAPLNRPDYVGTLCG